MAKSIIFPNLRQELEGLGYSFKTHCDTEVILYAWQAWGESCVDRLRGMFAFAIWDRRAANLVFGARPVRRQAAVLCGIG